MKFPVAKGQSAICHFDVYPAKPQGGTAQVWKVVNTSAKPRKDVDSFDIKFKKKSTPQQRQSERMILVFNIADKVQTKQNSWRFVHGGVMYCEGEADYMEDIRFVMSADGTVLTATVSCLADQEEKFQFSFLALCRDNKSGECQVYSSADPGGKIERGD